MEEQRSRRFLKVGALVVALGLAMAWGMVVGGGLVYAWIHWIETPGERGRVEVMTLDLPFEGLQERSAELGIVIVEVLPDSPAERVGLRAGDRIVAVDEGRVGLNRDLAAALDGYAPGERVVLRIARTGETSFEVRVRLAEHPEFDDRAYLGVRYASPSGQVPQLRVVPGGRLGEWLDVEPGQGEFQFFVVPGRKESH